MKDKELKYKMPGRLGTYRFHIRHCKISLLQPHFKIPSMKQEKKRKKEKLVLYKRETILHFFN